MICEATIATALRADGSTALRTLGGTAPIKLMPTPDGVYIVGTAAAPLNGDRISLTIDVADGTTLCVRSVAASLAWPGASPIPSQFSVTARVGAEAELQWLPEPLVPIAGSRHRMIAEVTLAGGARLVWREEIILGRHGETPGELSSRLAVTLGRRALLRQELRVGTLLADSPALLGSAKATGTVTFAGFPPPQAPGFPFADRHAESALLELEAGGLQVVATAEDAIQLRNLLDSGTSSVLGKPGRLTGATRRREHDPLIA